MMCTSVWFPIAQLLEGSQTKWAGVVLIFSSVGLSSCDAILSCVQSESVCGAGVSGLYKIGARKLGGRVFQYTI